MAKSALSETPEKTPETPPLKATEKTPRQAAKKAAKKRPKKRLGVKRHCQACGGKYYDLGKVPITCPTCKAVFDPEVLLKSRRVRPVIAATPAATTEKPEAGDAAKTPTEKALEANMGSVDETITPEGEVLEDDDNGIVIVKKDKEDDEEEKSVNGDEMPIEGNLDSVDEEEVEDE